MQTQTHIGTNTRDHQDVIRNTYLLDKESSPYVMVVKALLN